jgi:SAM-dependent methyltransferase
VRSSTTRFSSRVANYVKYRPRYPEAAYDLITARCGLSDDSVIADIGSGTGISSELFLAHGHHVTGVEPNAEMRAAAESLLAAYPRFTSMNGTAEHTTLPAASIDLLIAGQERVCFANAQRFDYAGLEGRLRSSSYSPEAGHPNHAPMLRALRTLFDTYQREGTVEVLYTTNVYLGLRSAADHLHVSTAT